jgi:hypothetical protein
LKACFPAAPTPLASSQRSFRVATRDFFLFLFVSLSFRRASKLLSNHAASLTVSQNCNNPQASFNLSDTRKTTARGKKQNDTKISQVARPQRPYTPNPQTHIHCTSSLSRIDPTPFLQSSSNLRNSTPRILSKLLPQILHQQNAPAADYEKGLKTTQELACTHTRTQERTLAHSPISEM